LSLVPAVFPVARIEVCVVQPEGRINFRFESNDEVDLVDNDEEAEVDNATADDCIKGDGGNDDLEGCGEDEEAEVDNATADDCIKGDGGNDDLEGCGEEHEEEECGNDDGD